VELTMQPIEEFKPPGEIKMKKIFVILLLLISSFAFSLNKAAVKRALEKEQGFAAKYQKQLTDNEKTIKDMSNDAKIKDYKKRLTELRQKKYVLEYTIKRTRRAKEMETLVPQLDAVVEEHTNLLHEYETFITTLN
jgi:ABC-type transporter MlaC component